MQRELYEDFGATDKPPKLKEYFPPIDPKVLFTMYQEPDVVASRLHFVFPNKIEVKFKSGEQMLPKFFTFMNLDNDVEQQYFHTMIFYEEISKKSIVDDYDAEAAYRRFIENEKRAKRKEEENRIRATRASSLTPGETRYNSTASEEEEI